jgi:hypothetical protein
MDSRDEQPPAGFDDRPLEERGLGADEDSADEAEAALSSLAAMERTEEAGLGSHPGSPRTSTYIDSEAIRADPGLPSDVPRGERPDQTSAASRALDPELPPRPGTRRRTRGAARKRGLRPDQGATKRRRGRALPILLFCVVALGTVAGVLVWSTPDEVPSATEEAQPDAPQTVNSAHDEGEGDQDSSDQDPAPTDGSSGQAAGTTSLEAPEEDEPQAEAEAQDESTDEAADQADDAAQEPEPGEESGGSRSAERQGNGGAGDVLPGDQEEDRPDDEDDEEDCAFWMWWC